MDDFRSYLAEDYQGLYARGPIDAAEDTADTADMHIRSFALDHLQVQVLATGFVLCTHRIELDASNVEGEGISGTYWGASLWRTVDGQRLLSYHTAIQAP